MRKMKDSEEQQKLWVQLLLHSEVKPRDADEKGCERSGLKSGPC